jgi:hypothetical protein
LVVPADQAVVVAALVQQIDVLPGARSAEFLNIDPLGFSEAGYGPSTK